MEGNQESIAGSGGSSLWRQSLEAQKQGESQFDGILLFLAVNLVASPLFDVYNLNTYVRFLAQPPVYRALGNREADPWLRSWADASIGEILGSLYSLVLGIALLWLFVRRKRQFRTAMIWSIVVGLAFPVILGLMEDGYTFGPIMRQLIPVITLNAYWALIWLPYFLYSQRVKRVFVR